MKRVFVTGGSGFIGTNLMRHLAERGIEAVNFDWKIPREGPAYSHIAGDIRDRTALAEAVQRFKPDVVIHLAARCDLRGKTIEDYSANTMGVHNMVDAIRATSSVERAIFTSSRYVHGNEVQPLRDDEYSPFTMYGASKVEGEKIVRSSHLDTPWLIVRPTSIWGPWFDVPYRSFFDAVRKGLYVHPKGERLYKSFGYVGNVVHQIAGFAAAPESAIRQRTFYLADYEPVEVRGMAEKIRSQFAAPAVRDVPLKLMQGVARIGDLCQLAGWKNPPLTSFRLKNLRTPMVYDISSTRDVVGELPATCEQGIERTVSWMRG